MDEDPPTEPRDSSNLRLYASAIAIVSGLHGIYVTTTGVQMTANAWFMLAVGLLVTMHGLILLTPRAPGPLASGVRMIVYGVIMIADPILVATRQGVPGGPLSADPIASMGTIAFGVLLLVSGAIMVVRERGAARERGT